MACFYLTYLIAILVLAILGIRVFCSGGAVLPAGEVEGKDGAGDALAGSDPSRRGFGAGNERYKLLLDYKFLKDFLSPAFHSVRVLQST